MSGADGETPPSSRDSYPPGLRWRSEPRRKNLEVPGALRNCAFTGPVAAPDAGPVAPVDSLNRGHNHGTRVVLTECGVGEPESAPVKLAGRRCRWGFCFSAGTVVAVGSSEPEIRCASSVVRAGGTATSEIAASARVGAGGSARTLTAHGCQRSRLVRLPVPTVQSLDWPS